MFKPISFVRCHQAMKTGHFLEARIGNYIKFYRQPSIEKISVPTFHFISSVMINFCENSVMETPYFIMLNKKQKILQILKLI